MQPIDHRPFRFIDPRAFRRQTHRGRYRAVRSLYWTIALCMSAAPAVAYVDPNSAGIVYQFLLPVIVALTSMWRSIVSGVRRAWDILKARWQRQR